MRKLQPPDTHYLLAAMGWLELGNPAEAAAELGQLDAARQWLQRAVRIGGKETIKKMALKDSDLEPLWAEIRKL